MTVTGSGTVPGLDVCRFVRDVARVGEPGGGARLMPP